jgi:hypothetical protein
VDYNPKREFLMRFRKEVLIYFTVKLNINRDSVRDKSGNGD